MHFLTRGLWLGLRLDCDQTSMGRSAENFSSCRGHLTAQYSIIYFEINGFCIFSKN
jgi:hypothetical protein